jgi:hypothetical protein
VGAQPRSKAQGYLPDRQKRAAAYWLGLTLLGVTLVEMIPAMIHSVRTEFPFLTLSGAPTWAQAVLALCLLQLVYILWMVTLPDWSTVWTMMLVYGAVSGVYGFGLAISLLTPRDQELMLQLEAVRRLTPLWCGAMVLLAFLAAFLCGRAGARWHRAYLAMVKAKGL